MFIDIHVFSNSKLFPYLIFFICIVGYSLMFIYIHNFSYKKLFLYFNLCLIENVDITSLFLIKK